MRIYYLVVGLAGIFAVFYVNRSWETEPAWVSFILGYLSGTSIGTALMLHDGERHRWLPAHQHAKGSQPAWSISTASSGSS